MQYHPRFVEKTAEPLCFSCASPNFRAQEAPIKLIFHRPNDYLYVDYLLNPLPALAIVGMALNDHFLKYAYPSLVTGKISDFLGMFYFPLFLCALYCLFFNYVLNRRKRKVYYIGQPLMIATMAISGGLMMAVKLSPGFSKWLEVQFSRFLFEITLTSDPSDMLSLLALPAAYFYASFFFDYHKRSMN